MEVTRNVLVRENRFWDFKGRLDYVDDWFMMKNPFLVTSILVTYLLFVLKIGPQYMKNRQPFQLKNVILAYNVAQIILSVYIFYIGSSLFKDYGILETKCNMNKDDLKRRLTAGHYIYLFAKITELLDTVFFVLRKKWNQISFLHVYHHSLMMVISWISLKYEPSYSATFTGTANAFVHVIMYGYYALSSFPELTKYLWWKKYITTLQLIQFLMIFVHVLVNSTISECPFSYFLLTTCISHLFLFFYLFSDFYVKNYTKNKKVNM